MQKYGILLEQLAPHGQAAVQAAERAGARTIIYRDKVPVAAVVPAHELNELSVSFDDSNPDPLLSLCGTCQQDTFVDALMGELTRTVLFKRGRR